MIIKIVKWTLVCSGIILVFFVSYFITNKYFIPEQSMALPEFPVIESDVESEERGEFSDIPAYPEAKQNYFVPEEKHRKIIGAAMYDSNDQPTDIINWYSENMPKYGWWPMTELMKGAIGEEEYKEEMRGNPDAQAEIFIRGNRICQVGADIEEDKTRLNVSVVYSELAVDNIMGHGGDPHVELFLIYRYNFGAQASGKRVNNTEDGYSYILPDGFSDSIIIAPYNDPPNYNFCKDEEQDCAPVGTNQNLKGYFSDRVAGDPDYDRLVLRSEDKKRAVEIKILRSDEPPYYDREAASAVIQSFQFN